MTDFRHVDRVPEALSKWAEGEPVAGIATALGVSRGWVYRTLKRHEVFERERQALPPAEVMAARVAQLQGRGYRLVEIGRITGWSRKSIYRARRAVGAPPVRRNVTAQEVAAMIESYQAARRVRTVARRVGRDWATVRAVLDRAVVYEPAGRGHKPAAGHPWRVDYRR